MISVSAARPHHAHQMHIIETEAFAAPWSEAAIEEEILHKHSYAFVATTENDAVVGHIYMRHIINEGHIINIAVQKSHRRAGIGSQLLSALMVAAENLELIGLTLEVRQSNTAAQKMYKKHGFVPEGIRTNYYANPTENGIVMWRYF